MTQAASNPNIAPSLVEGFLSRGVRLKGYGPGSKHTQVCPQCGGGSSKEQSLRCFVDADGSGGGAKCYRGKCSFSFGFHVLGSAPSSSAAYRVYKPAPKHERSGVPAAMVEWFKARGISEATVRHCGITTIPRLWFRGRGENPDGEFPAMVFPYVYRGELQRNKYRCSRHKAFRQDDDTRPTLWMVDDWTEGKAEMVVFCEGEPDAMAAIEAGYYATTLPDGAGKEKAGQAEEGPLTGRFAPIAECAEEVQRVKTWVIVPQQDEPGQAHAAALVRRLGPQRCRIARLPEGVKDLNDLLLRDGPEAVHAAIDGSVWAKIEGLNDPDAEEIAAEWEKPRGRSYSTGIAELDELVRISEEPQMWVISGHPGHGKSTLVKYLIAHTVREIGWRWAVFAKEEYSQQSYLAHLAAAHLRKPTWGRGDLLRASDIVASRDFFRHITMLDPPGDSPTLDDILDLADIAVTRSGINALAVDVWNEVNHEPPGKISKTDWINRQLIKFRSFCYSRGVHGFLVIHPFNERNKGNVRAIPDGSQISDSANIERKCTIGLSIHQGEEPGTSQVMLWKQRNRQYGKLGKCVIGIDPATGVFSSLRDAVMAGPPPRPPTPVFYGGVPVGA